MSTIDEILDNKQRGRSRLNPEGDPNAPVNGGEKSLRETVTQPVATEEPVAEEPKRLSYAEMYEKFNKSKLPTPEELAEEQKRNKQRAVIAAIGDGLSALTNMYFVNRGAPNMYTGKNTLSEREKKRRDALKKEREAQRESYEKGYMNALQLDDAWNDKERQWKRTLANDKANSISKDIKMRYNIALNNLDVQLKQGKVSEQEYKTEKAKIEAARANEVQQSIINRNNNAYQKEFLAYDEDGNEHYFRTKEAAEAFARQHNTWEDISSTSTTERTTGGKRPQTTTTKTTKVESGRSVKPVKKTGNKDFSRYKVGDKKDFSQYKIK